MWGVGGEYEVLWSAVANVAKAVTTTVCDRMA